MFRIPAQLKFFLKTKKKKDETEFPKSEWESFILRQHIDVLELRERTRFLFNQETFGRSTTSSKTEVKEIISSSFVMQLIFKFLEERGLNRTVDQLKEELLPSGSFF